jgi:hypothetical protein
VRWAVGMFEVQIVHHWEDMRRWMHMYVWLRSLGSDSLCLFILVEITMFSLGDYP